MSAADDIAAATVITSHQNVDFDAFAAAVGVSKLYPEARIVFTGSLNPNVREFATLHGEDLPLLGIRSLDLESVRRLIVVDTSECSRLGELGALCERGNVEVIVFDHHGGAFAERPAFVTGDNWVVSTDGAQATSVLHILRERDVPLSSLEATILALGIHEDTGSLTYPRTTVRDAEMLAVAMRLGAAQPLIERFLHSPLSGAQRALLLRMLDEVRTVRVRGQDVHVLALSTDEYVDGLSVLAHKVMDLLDAEVLLQAVEAENRVFVTGRARTASVDVGALLRVVGGGGHAQAGSAVARNANPEEIISRLVSALEGQAATLPTAADIMSRPVRFIDADTSVADALVAAQHYGHSGISVKEEGWVAGIVGRRDLDKAIRHGLGHAPVKGVMTRNVVYAKESSTMEELRRLMVDTNVGRLPIVADEAYDRVQQAGRLRGGGRGRHRHSNGRPCRVPGTGGRARPRPRPGRSGPSSRSPSSRSSGASSAKRRPCRTTFTASTWSGGSCGTCCSNARTPMSTSPWRATASSSPGAWPATWAGGSGPTGSSRRPWCSFPPRSWDSAPEWLVPSSEPFHVDVATTRTEFYDYPAALPTVEHASIRQDLFRRDFSVNAMAVSLKGDAFGQVIDPFGGLRDLERGALRVLHNLSFIEDPTRIFRAIRYENRYQLPHGRAHQRPGEGLRRHAPGGRPVERPPPRRARRTPERGRT